MGWGWRSEMKDVNIDPKEIEGLYIKCLICEYKVPLGVTRVGGLHYYCPNCRTQVFANSAKSCAQLIEWAREDTAAEKG